MTSSPGCAKRAVARAAVCVLSIAGFMMGDMAAAQQPLLLAPITVTGSRLGGPAAATTIITREEIEARAPVTVLDLLRTVPGLHVDEPGGQGGVGSVYLRGADPHVTLVLVDGIKVNDPTNTRGGSYDFANLPPEAVERIEVVRGPFSAIHGSDAMAGVISIITRQGAGGARNSAELAGGGFGYGRAAGFLGTTLGAASLSLGAAYTDGGEPVEGSRFHGRSLSAGFTGRIGEATSLGLSGRLAESRRSAFPEDSGGPRFAVLRDTDRRASDEAGLGFDLRHDLSEAWQAALRLSAASHDEQADSPGVAPGVRDPFGIPPNRSDSSYRRYAATVSTAYAIDPAVTLAAGLDAQVEEGESRGTLDVGFPLATRFDLERTSWAPFIEAELRPLEDIVVQVGLRLDLPEDFDRQFSPRLAASWRLVPETQLRASWARGFKLPSFFALGNPIVGNPGLRPERSEGFEVGVNQQVLRELGLDVALFHTRYSQAIDLEEGPPLRLVNRSAILARGVEVRLDWRPSAELTLSPSLTYVETDIEESDERLRNRPRWRGGITVFWRPEPALEFGLVVSHVGEVFDSSIPTGDRTLDAYQRVDVSVSKRLAPGASVFLAVQNLLDRDYEEAIGFPGPGFFPRAGARITF